MMTIRQTIESGALFTETEKSVAQYILDRPNDVLDMSIREFAQITFTSTPTVLRVCRKLGFDGYKEFKKALILELENEKHFVAQVDPSQPFRGFESPNQIVGSMAALYKESVESTAALLNISALSQVADQIFHARRLFLYAIGDTQITCRLFANKLLKLNIHPILATENYQEMQETYNLTREDFALFVSYEGMYDWFMKCASVLKRRRIRSCVITGNSDSPLTGLCANTILLPDREGIIKIATFHSQISIGFVLNVLYSLIYSKDYEGYGQHKNVLDNVLYRYAEHRQKM